MHAQASRSNLQARVAAVAGKGHLATPSSAQQGPRSGSHTSSGEAGDAAGQTDASAKGTTLNGTATPLQLLPVHNHLSHEGAAGTVAGAEHGPNSAFEAASDPNSRSSDAAARRAAEEKWKRVVPVAGQLLDIFMQRRAESASPEQEGAEAHAACMVQPGMGPAAHQVQHDGAAAAGPADCGDPLQAARQPPAALSGRGDESAVGAVELQQQPEQQQPSTAVATTPSSPRAGTGTWPAAGFSGTAEGEGGAHAQEQGQSQVQGQAAAPQRHAPVQPKALPQHLLGYAQVSCFSCAVMPW